VKRGLPSSNLRSGFGITRRAMWSCRTLDAAFKAVRRPDLTISRRFGRAKREED
jgi:hypothetical protein